MNRQTMNDQETQDLRRSEWYAKKRFEYVAPGTGMDSLQKRQEAQLKREADGDILFA